MGHGNKYGATVVHQDSSSHRDASVGSWATRSSFNDYTSSSGCSSESSSVWEGHCRDPESKGSMKSVTERRSHKGGKVVVVNHRKGNKEPAPTPSYSDASGYGRR